MKRSIQAAALVVAAAFTAAPGTAPGPEDKVTFFPAEEVTSAFARGAVLYGGTHYMIHASRREGAGQAEVHSRDADLIYVQEGTATFVTGGTVTDPKTVAMDEIRGASIEGGEIRTLSRGDVIIVPEKTPHWFKEVRGPFLYYVVKVR